MQQQQCELIACLERSFQELLASNAALCARFNRLEQLVLQHRSVFVRQVEQRQHRSSSAGADNSVPSRVGFGSHVLAYSGRFNGDVASVDEMLPKPFSATLWRNGDQPETRSSQAEKNVLHTDGSVGSETDDVSSSSAVNSQHDHWQNVAVSSEVDAWPQTTSSNTQC